jgi:CubicO group peptidase (beta-lactamase class C family)
MASPPPVPQSFDEFEALVRESVGTDLVPSMAYGISRKRNVLLTGAAGYADRENGIPAGPRTAYSLASVTKPLSSTLLAMYAERGLVDLDSSINAQLSGVQIESRAGNADAATVRQVADHSSGLPTHYQFYYADEPLPRLGASGAIVRYAKTFTVPGERHVYSNLGYAVLEQLIEQVSGQTLADAMKRQLFAPLGMDSSSLGPPSHGKAAVPYGPDGVGYPAYDFDHRGGSAAFGSVDDLLAFGQFHLGYGPELLDARSLDDAHRPTSSTEGPAQYGLGWGMLSDRHGLASIHHTGFMGGVSCIVRLIPELDLTIVVLTNGQSQLPFRMSDYLVAIVSKEYRKRLELAEEEPKPPAADFPDRLVGTWRGHVDASEGHIPMMLRVSGPGQAIACIGGVDYSVEGLECRNGQLLAVSDGDLRVPDVTPRPYRVHFDLTERAGSILSGMALTMSQANEGSGGAPARRYGAALAFWTELKRTTY